MKYGRQQLAGVLTKMLHASCDTTTVLDEWYRGIIIVNLKQCDNWHRITLFVSGKLLCMALLHCCHWIVEKQLWEKQADWSLWMIISYLSVNFISLVKAFTNVHCFSGLHWTVNMFYLLYHHSHCYICTDKGSTDFFETEPGQHQGCVPSAFLFFFAINFFMRRSAN